MDVDKLIDHDSTLHVTMHKVITMNSLFHLTHGTRVQEINEKYCKFMLVSMEYGFNEIEKEINHIDC